VTAHVAEVIVALFIPKRQALIGLAIFFPLLLLAIFIIAKNSYEYEVTEQFIAHDPQVAAIIGKVQQVNFKYWKGFESVDGNGGHAKFWFSATTEKGKFTILIYLRNCSEEWLVETVDIYAQNREKLESHLNNQAGQHARRLE